MRRLEEKLAGMAEVYDYDHTLPMASQVAEANVIMLGHNKVTADDMKHAPHLKLIHQHGSGTDGVDMVAAKARGVIVANVPGGNSTAVAEHSLALLLFEAKRFGHARTSIDSYTVGAPSTLEIKGKTLLIVGLGSSGSKLAQMTKALGMRVLATKGQPDTESAAHVDELGGPQDLHRFLPQADFVAMHSALTPQTRSIIGTRELELMKPTAHLINASRGALVDYDALCKSLNEGGIAGAAFDTFWTEPVDPDDALLCTEGFFLTPHVAGFSDSAIEHVTEIVVQNIQSLAVNEPLRNVVSDS